MSIHITSVNISKMVVNTGKDCGLTLQPTTTIGPVAPKVASVDKLQKQLTDLAQGKGIPEEKVDTKPFPVEDGAKKNEIKEMNNRQLM